MTDNGYVTITKRLDTLNRIRIDCNAMEAAGANAGDLVEVKFRVVKKKEE